MRYHGVDLHKKHATVSVRDEAGGQIAFMGREFDIEGYVGRLTSEDVVVVEASSGALFWAERIGQRGARCLVVDAYRFRIIRDSWQKTALVFLSEVGDIHRFSSARKLHAYLGVVPRTRSSGGKTLSGAINRASRHLARTLFTQAAPHLASSSPSMSKFYRELVGRRGYGRARIALLRKVFGVMRRMLVEGEQYRGLEKALYARKIHAYERELKKVEVKQEAA